MAGTIQPPPPTSESPEGWITTKATARASAGSLASSCRPARATVRPDRVRPRQGMPRRQPHHLHPRPDLVTLVLQENRAWVEVVLLVPRFDFVDPLVRRRFEMNVAAIMAGWGGCVSLLLLMGSVTPFRIRSMALMQRRLRELEREILELRTLPLRQQEEDEILAAEAHLDIRAKKVMTEKMRRDRMLRDGDELERSPARGGFDRAPAAASARPRLASADSGVRPVVTGRADGPAGPSEFPAPQLGRRARRGPDEEGRNRHGADEFDRATSSPGFDRATSGPGFYRARRALGFLRPRTRNELRPGRADLPRGRLRGRLVVRAPAQARP